MFKVTVSGSYVLSGKLSEIDQYETTFDMAEGREAEARAIIQNSGILDERLRKEKKSYRRWRTCQVIDIVEVKDDNTSVDAELESLFIEAVNLACVPVSYKRLRKNEAKKAALVEAIKNKKTRIVKAKARKGGLKREAA